MRRLRLFLFRHRVERAGEAPRETAEQPCQFSVKLLSRGDAGECNDTLDVYILSVNVTALDGNFVLILLCRVYDDLRRAGLVLGERDSGGAVEIRVESRDAQFVERALDEACFSILCKPRFYCGIPL